MPPLLVPPPPPPPPQAQREATATIELNKTNSRRSAPNFINGLTCILITSTNGGPLQIKSRHCAISATALDYSFAHMRAFSSFPEDLEHLGIREPPGDLARKRMSKLSYGSSIGVPKKLSSDGVFVFEDFFPLCVGQPVMNISRLPPRPHPNQNSFPSISSPPSHNLPSH